MTPLALAIVGILVAVFVHYALGLAMILVALVWAFWPAIERRR